MASTCTMPIAVVQSRLTYLMMAGKHRNEDYNITCIISKGEINRLITDGLGKPLEQCLPRSAYYSFVILGSRHLPMPDRLVLTLPPQLCESASKMDIVRILSMQCCL